ncbi:hypothetical protein ACNOYE_26915 [Nannocystaceae bacterium ST9]
MSEVEAMYDDTEQAERAMALLRHDDDVAEIRFVEPPHDLPLQDTRARLGLVIGAGFGVVLGLLAGAMVAWRVGDVVTGSAAWMLALGSMLLGSLAGGLAFALEDRAPPPASSGTLWMRTSSIQVGRLIKRLHRLGAHRVEILDPIELPGFARLRH